MRALRHLFSPPVGSRFGGEDMQRIQQAIAASERGHCAEICFAVERALSLSDLLAGRDARARASIVFTQLRVWDTQGNNGVLIYVLLAEHAIEIVPDRGARSCIPPQAWQHACALIRQGFAENRYADAIISAIDSLTPSLAAQYPCASGIGSAPANPDELADFPHIL